MLRGASDASSWRRPAERVTRFGFWPAILARRLDCSRRKTFELVATEGVVQPDLEPLFAALDADPPGTLDAVHDVANMPQQKEPQRVRDDLDAMKG